MAATFPRFNELPAELRSKVWDHALQDEYGTIGGSDRRIEFYDFQKASSVSIALSRSYPSLFSVS
jgi:adenylosuccinate synthase